MARVAVERGFRHVTVSSVLERGSIAHSTFYDHFDSLDACFLALLDDVLDHSIALISEACDEGERSWPESVAAALAATLFFLDAEPVLARVCLVESMAAGATALEHRARALRAIAVMLDAGRDRSSGNGPESPLDAIGIVMAIAGVLHDQLVSGQAPPLTSQLERLVGFVLGRRPSLDSLAAALPRAKRPGTGLTWMHSSGRLPAGNADVTLPKALSHPNSFRARACILYLAEHSDASNQAIAAGINLRHHGQMSSLLRRLEREGLLAKRAGGAGYPNAWRLTPDGAQVARALKLVVSV